MQMNTSASGAMTWPAIKQSYAKVAGAPAQDSPAVVKGASAAGFVQGPAPGPASSEQTAAADTADGTEDRFLKLLVAQMRNQDPLNPMDNAQVTSQLAQISTVRGIESLNKTMSAFAAANGHGSVTSSVAMLGKQVLVAGNSFSYQPPAAGGTTRLGFELAASASAARLEIVNASGAVVHSRTMGSQAAGVQTFEWNGKSGSGATVPAGPLSIRITAIDGKDTVQATPLVPARVVGVSQAEGGTRLELDGAAPVAPADVRVIL